MPAPAAAQFFAFDLDGVLADTEALHSEAKLIMLRRFGIHDTPDMTPYIGHPIAAFWGAMKKLYPQIWEEFPVLDRMQFSTILELLEEKQFLPSAGLLPLLERLAELKTPCGIYSSSDRFYVDGVLRFFDVQRFFPFIIAGDEVPRRKPFPDGYLKVAAIAGADPARSIAVEDSAAGVAAAKAAGMRVVGYRNPTSGDQDLSRADWRVDSLAEVLQII